MASTLLFQRLKSVARDLDNVKVGLEATSHYSYNILGFLLGKGLSTFVLNPLHTNLYRKSTSLRRTKTDCVDARTIAAMMMSDVILKSYTAISYHNEELKSLSRYRFDKVRQRAKLKQSISRLVTILFPELKKTRSFAPHSVGLCSAYRTPRRKAGRFRHLTHLANLLFTASKGYYDRSKVVELCNAARRSIGSGMPAKSLEL